MLKRFSKSKLRLWLKGYRTIGIKDENSNPKRYALWYKKFVGYIHRQRREILQKDIFSRMRKKGSKTDTSSR